MVLNPDCLPLPLCFLIQSLWLGPNNCPGDAGAGGLGTILRSIRVTGSMEEGEDLGEEHSQEAGVTQWPGDIDRIL